MLLRPTLRLTLLLLPCVGCAKNRDEAPDDLDSLSHFLLTHWHDEEATAQGMSDLASWLDSEGREEPATSEGFVLTPLDELEVVPFPHADEPVENAIGVAVTGVSPHDIEAHAGLIIEEDQRWNSEDTYLRYDRTITSGDAATFAAGSGLIETDNDIDKKGAFGVHIEYTLDKDYRWVTTDDGKRAIVARSIAPEKRCAGDDEKNCVVLAFTVDLFFEPEPGETLRLTSGWSYITTAVDGLVSEDYLIAQMAKGVRDIYANTDAELDARAE